MKRVYTFPFGVVSRLPSRLAPHVTLGDVERDGRIRSFSVDRVAHTEVAEGQSGVIGVEVAVRFHEDQTVVAVGLTVFTRPVPVPGRNVWGLGPPVLKTVRGAWLVQKGEAIEEPRRCCENYQKGRTVECEALEANDCAWRLEDLARRAEIAAQGKS